MEQKAAKSAKEQRMPVFFFAALANFCSKTAGA
jgi:hypothetical protein